MTMFFLSLSIVDILCSERRDVQLKQRARVTSESRLVKIKRQSDCGIKSPEE